MTMPKIGPFEAYSDRYDQWFEKNRKVYDAELNAIRSLIPSPDAKGLEVGIGSGKFAAPLGIKIGVDPSASMASKAEAMGIRVYRNVAESLPFRDSMFD
jgi:SAM-dependent methyltransferase